MNAYSWIHLDDCEIIKKTCGVMLIRYCGKEHWVPLSQLDCENRYDEGDKGITVTITEWFVGKEGIEVQEDCD